MRPRRSLPGLLAGALALALALTSCGGSDNLAKDDSNSSSPGAAKGSLTVGSAGFTESQVMAEMYKALLEKAGYTVDIKTVDNRELYEPALEKGEIDVVPEYAATMADFLNHKDNGPDAPTVASSDLDKTLQSLTDLGQKRGLTVLEPAQAVDQNAFAVTKKYASAHNLTTLSDLGKTHESVVLAATEECPDRPYCQPGLKKTYGIKVTKLEPLGFDTPQVKAALTSDKAQLGLVATTDGTLSSAGLVVLDDDKNLQNADNLVPVVNSKSAGGKQVSEALNKLAPVLTTSDLAALNKKVDVERQKASDAAQQYLQQKGLL